jgi:hypothetical protein
VDAAAAACGREIDSPSCGSLALATSFADVLGRIEVEASGFVGLAQPLGFLDGVAQQAVLAQRVLEDAAQDRQDGRRQTTDATISGMSDAQITGGCLCGGVRFVLTESPHGAGYCHCTRCQRRTGTAASAQARIDGRTLRLLQGEDLLRNWRHPDGGHEKHFCGVCGSHLFSRSPENPAQMSVRMGAFDEDPGVRPSWRSFVAYAAPWEPIPNDGLERFAEARPRL